MKQDLANDLLNALTMQIAVLDAGGAIVAVNDEWKRFARENGGDAEASYLGANYLKVCEQAVLHGAGDEAEAMYAGMLALLRGEQERFSIEYPCHSPTEQRWFIGHISSFSHRGNTYVVATHEKKWRHKSAQCYKWKLWA